MQVQVAMPSPFLAFRILLTFALIGLHIIHCNPIPSRASRQLLASDALTWRTGTLVIRTMSFANGDDAEAYLLRTSSKSRLIELQVDESLVSFVYPGQNITVHGSFVDEDTLLVVEMFATDLHTSSSSYVADNPSPSEASPPQNRRKAAEEASLQKGDSSQSTSDYSE